MGWLLKLQPKLSKEVAEAGATRPTPQSYAAFGKSLKPSVVPGLSLS